mgnify:FL=1
MYVSSFCRYTFEIAPVVTMMELELIQKAGVELFGYPQVKFSGSSTNNFKNKFILIETLIKTYSFSLTMLTGSQKTGVRIVILGLLKLELSSGH